jgi:hypothetical protein
MRDLIRPKIADSLAMTVCPRRRGRLSRRGWGATWRAAVFLARYFDRREELIQVAAELDDPETRQWEVRALQSAAAEHPGASLHLVTLTPESAQGIPEQIQVHSAALWLLAAEK